MKEKRGDIVWGDKADDTGKLCARFCWEMTGCHGCIAVPPRPGPRRLLQLLQPRQCQWSGPPQCPWPRPRSPRRDRSTRRRCVSWDCNIYWLIADSLEKVSYTVAQGNKRTYIHIYHEINALGLQDRAFREDDVSFLYSRVIVNLIIIRIIIFIYRSHSTTTSTRASTWTRTTSEWRIMMSGWRRYGRLGNTYWC